MLKRSVVIVSLAVLAVGLAVAGFLYYQDYQRRAEWRSFLDEAMPQIVAAQESLAYAEQALATAEEAEIPEEDLEPLQTQTVATWNLVHRVSRLAEYVQPVSDEGGYLAKTYRPRMNASAQSETAAAMDVFTDVTDGADYEVTQPAGLKIKIERYGKMLGDLDSASEQLAQDVHEVEVLIERTLSDLLRRLDGLTQKITPKTKEASELLTASADLVGTTPEWVALDNAVIDAGTLRKTLRNLDRNKLPEVREVVEHAEELEGELNERFDALLTKVEETEAAIRYQEQFAGSTPRYQAPQYTWVPPANQGTDGSENSGSTGSGSSPETSVDPPSEGDGGSEDGGEGNGESEQQED